MAPSDADEALDDGQASQVAMDEAAGEGVDAAAAAAAVQSRLADRLADRLAMRVALGLRPRYPSAGAKRNNLHQHLIPTFCAAQSSGWPSALLWAYNPVPKCCCKKK